ncbi:DUF4340 domain-containing protein [Desulfobulbus sp.]|uniref:DUF4340 domain-containing protein n=1 Tax=Desulfobulbus sp. TaxID=895 RepID=UPI00286F3A02|nr:DUF4340 domain-containing protein [Desulfobulbus sp.]
MKRLIVGCLILLLAQIGLLAATRLIDRTGAARSEKESLLAFKAADIDEVLLEDGEGHHLALKKDKDRWLLPEAESFPADSARVQDLIDRLAGMQRGWPEATTAEAATRFKVAPDRYVRKLNLLKNGTAQAIVYFGTSPGLRKMYLRGDNDPEIQSLTLSPHDLELKTDSWIDTKILQLKPERIKRIELPGLRLERGQEGLQPADLKPDEEVVKDRRDALVNRLAGLTVTGLLGTEVKPEYGLQTSVLKCSVELDHGETVEYVFGQPQKPAGKDAPPADLSFVLKVSNQGQLFRVDAWQVDELKKAVRSALVRTKTPAPAASAAPSPVPVGQPAVQAQ